MYQHQFPHQELLPGSEPIRITLQKKPYGSHDLDVQ